MIQDPFVHLVELVDAHPSPLPGDTAPDWPCPGCGRSRPGRAAWEVSVRNQVGPALRREVLLCASCVEELRSGTQASDRSRASA